ncbi:hypothetical protein QOT17_010783 [Balamuthia mandrillaris]
MLIIDLQVVEWLHTSIIILIPSNSPWKSPLTIIPKKNADSNITQWCVCIDPCRHTSALTHSVPLLLKTASKLHSHRMVIITYIHAPKLIKYYWDLLKQSSSSSTSS